MYEQTWFSLLLRLCPGIIIGSSEYIENASSFNMFLDQEHIIAKWSYLTDSHVDSTVVLSNVEVEILIINSHVPSLGQFPFETKETESK